MAVSGKDMLQVLIYERYVNKDAYLDIHKKSMEFLAFKKKMMAMNEEGVKDQLGWEMTGQSYQKPVGFV
jgi:quinol monooxygenase YgiN